VESQTCAEPSRTEGIAGSRTNEDNPICRAFATKHRLTRLPENRGVPGSSPGLATTKTPMASGFSAFGASRLITPIGYPIGCWDPNATRVRHSRPSVDRRSGLVRGEVDMIPRRDLGPVCPGVTRCVQLLDLGARCASTPERVDNPAAEDEAGVTESGSQASASIIDTVQTESPRWRALCVRPRRRARPCYPLKGCVPQSGDWSVPPCVICVRWVPSALTV
jgi:hypothetical protein